MTGHLGPGHLQDIMDQLSRLPRNILPLSGVLPGSATRISSRHRRHSIQPGALAQTVREPHPNPNNPVSWNILGMSSQVQLHGHPNWSRKFQLLACMVLVGLFQAMATSIDHCALTTGDWCGKYYLQDEVPSKPPPRGSKACPNDCSGVGVCHYDFGMCYCPAGYAGEDCSTPDKRECFEMGPDFRDKGWHQYSGWMHTRCAGICDHDIAMCYCPPETKFGHIPAPPGSPPGTPPVKQGRQMFWCQPSSDENDTKVFWGSVPYDNLFGPEGWCNEAQSKFQCPCRLDGHIGQYCNIPVEQVCMNQCSGRGTCIQGFCKCYAGYYGHDCSRHREGAFAIHGDEEYLKPWLKQVVLPVPAAQDPSVRPTRRRPFIYVYDLDPEFNTDIMQYRIERWHCTYRMWGFGNGSEWIDANNYATETYLHELMLTSEHRTFDPEEADFFFVPTHSGCLFDVVGWAPKPTWPKDVGGNRVFGAANMIRAAAMWINETFPWFHRHGGRDHIWFMPHDEGACYAPKEIWQGVVLSHWGRMDFPHESNTQYGADNYSMDNHHPALTESFLSYTSKAHPCFDPKKDLVIPSFKRSPHYSGSIYLGGVQRERDVLMFFRGDVGRHRQDDRGCIYSRCIRQTLLNLSVEQQWKEKHNVHYGEREDNQDGYGVMLGRSKFCLALPGDGWSARLEDAILHGCLPVIIMDNTQVPYESILDFSKFSLRVPEANMINLIDLVKAVTEDQIKEMQMQLAKVWHRFRWVGLPMTDRSEQQTVQTLKAENGGIKREQAGSERAATTDDGAFSTLMQWLYSRMSVVRGAP